jgi:hypothetical protein
METKSTLLILRIAVSDRSMLPMPVDTRREGKMKKLLLLKNKTCIRFTGVG